MPPLEPTGGELGRGRATRGQVGLYIAGWILLVVGLGASVWTYLVAAEPPSDALGYDLAGGGAFAIRPQDSKRYEYEMERFGGKASILATEIRSAFDRLWQGRERAFTLGALTLLAALGCFLLAEALPDLPSFDFDLSPSPALEPRPKPSPPAGPEAPP